MDYLLFPLDFLNRVYKINTSPFEKKKLKKGKRYAKECHCIIGSLLRDSELSFEDGVKLVEQFSQIFGTVDVFILENDSEDRTRELWGRYSKKCPSNVKIFLLSENDIPSQDRKLVERKTVAHEHSYPRIKKMVKLRNILLENIYSKSRQSDNSYIFITDLDIRGNLHKLGIYDTFYHFSKSRADAIGCNGLTWNCFYFDDYAFKDPDTNRIYSTIDVPVNQGLYPVISSFSGGVFYTYDSLKKLRYKFKTFHKKVVCEHVVLNKKIKRFYINTNMIYNIKSH